MKQAFALGRKVVSVGVLNAVWLDDLEEALSRHARCDWGEVCEEDRQENELSLKEGFRLFSVHRSGSGKKFWIITEADRSVTTVLLPEEY